MDDDTVDLVVRIPADLHAAVKERAEQEDRSMAAVIRVALRRYIAQPDREPRWRGETVDVGIDGSCLPGPIILPWPPGTAVRVDEDTT
jgi:hypothetical protein